MNLDGKVIEILVVTHDGPMSYTGPTPAPAGCEMVAGVRYSDATKFRYAEYVRAAMAMATERLLKSLEDEGVLLS